MWQTCRLRYEDEHMNNNYNRWSGNNINSIPIEIQNMESLELVDLSNNRITQLPKEVFEINDEHSNVLEIHHDLANQLILLELFY